MYVLVASIVAQFAIGIFAWLNAAMKSQTKYPQLAKLGVEVKSDDGIDYVCPKELTRALKRRGIQNAFSHFYGVQTQSMHGPYADDVEAVLVRLFTGNRTGSQLEWD